MSRIFERYFIVVTIIFVALSGAAGTGFADELSPATSCNVIPADGLNGLTNDRLYFASEIHQQLADDPSTDSCDWLQCFLDDVPGTAHANATLIIDRLCRISTGIRVPGRFTLSGVGSAGEGVLVFEDLPLYSSAIQFGQPGSNSNISVRDLTITYDGDPERVIGLDLSGSHTVSLEHLKVQNFTIGVFAEKSIYVSIERSNISLNNINLYLGAKTSSWRVRDNIMSRALKWSVNIGSPGSQEHIFSGNRFECNGHDDYTLDGTGCHNNPIDQGGGAVRNAGTGVQFSQNRFEGNNADPAIILRTTLGDNVPADRDIVIRPGALFTRVLSNDIGGVIIDNGSQTECAHNIRRFQFDQNDPDAKTDTGC